MTVLDDLGEAEMTEPPAASPTPEELADLRLAHNRPYSASDGLRCRRDLESHPCPTLRLLDALEAAQRKVEQLPYAEASGHYCQGMTEAWSDAQAAIGREIAVTERAERAERERDAALPILERVKMAHGFVDVRDGDGVPIPICVCGDEYCGYYPLLLAQPFGTTQKTTPTPEELADMRGLHRPEPTGNGAVHRCRFCRGVYPCDTIRLLDALEAAREHIEQLKTAAEDWCSMAMAATSGVDWGATTRALTERAEQAERERDALREALVTIQRGRMAHHSGGDSGMIFDSFDAEVERARRGYWTVDDRAMDKALAALAQPAAPATEEMP